MVRGAAQHHSVHVLQLARDRLMRLDASVDDDRELREVLLQAMHIVVLEGRDLAVLLRRKALQDGVARVDQKGVCSGRGDRTDEIAHEAIVFELVDADAMLDRDR